MKDETINYLKINLLMSFRQFNQAVIGSITHIRKKHINLLTLKQDGSIIKYRRLNIILRLSICFLPIINIICLAASMWS